MPQSIAMCPYCSHATMCVAIPGESEKSLDPVVYLKDYELVSFHCPHLVYVGTVKNVDGQENDKKSHTGLLMNGSHWFCSDFNTMSEDVRHYVRGLAGHPDGEPHTVVPQSQFSKQKSRGERKGARYTSDKPDGRLNYSHEIDPDYEIKSFVIYAQRARTFLAEVIEIVDAAAAAAKPAVDGETPATIVL